MKNILVQKTNNKEWLENGKYVDYTPLGYFTNNKKLEDIIGDSDCVILTLGIIETLIDEAQEDGDEMFLNWLVAIWNTTEKDKIIVMEIDEE